SSGGTTFELQELMLATKQAERERVAYESLAPVVTRAGDSDEVVRRKVWDLTRLMTQTALGDTWNLLAAHRSGVTGAADGTEKTSFEYVNNDPYLDITIRVKQDLSRFINGNKAAYVELSDKFSYQQVELKLRLKAEDLGRDLKEDSLEVVSGTVGTRMVPDPAQAGP
ncbi:MAG: hypothetical protein ABWZ27_00670, partial [Aestuariivirgaceae bacterium]